MKSTSQLLQPDVTEQIGIYHLFMLGLSIFVVAVASLEVLIELDSDSAMILSYADTAICLIFLFDFIYQIKNSDNKVKYLYTWGWIDLLSSIPAVSIFRYARIIRILRVLRMIRAARASRHLLQHVMKKRAECLTATTILFSTIVLLFSSLAILRVESHHPESNINNAHDALWWTFVTMTTVGYGDYYPVTPEGRLIAIALMICGISIFGVFTGLISTRFLAAGEDEQTKMLKDLQHEIQELKVLIKKEDSSQD